MSEHMVQVHCDTLIQAVNKQDVAMATHAIVSLISIGLTALVRLSEAQTARAEMVRKEMEHRDSLRRRG